MKTSKGKFIVFEGGEGSGKTSIIKLLKKDLGRDYKICTTREPGGSLSPISEKIREVILDKNHTEMNPLTEALLYAASRRQHLQDFILPSLKEDYIVLCDRYLGSSIVYQGCAREQDIAIIEQINDVGGDILRPDLTIVIDVDPIIGLSRISSREEDMNRLDLEKIEFHEKVRQGYLELKNNKKIGKVVVVNGNENLIGVYSEVRKIILECIG